jgi:sec-independent protein translocase protein TatC
VQNASTPKSRNPFKRFKTTASTEVEDSDLIDVLNKTVNNPAGLLEHIDALRKHLLRALVAMALATMFSFIFAPQVIDLLARPVGGIQSLTAIDITEPISVFFRVSLLMGFTIALPYVALEVLLFLAPGLKPNELRFGILALPAVALFFIGGVSFAYFVMMPVAIPFLMNFLEVGAELRPASYISFVTGLLFWIGISFEFPLVIYVLARMRLVNHRVLLEQWRIAVVVIAVFAAMVTPTVDPINMSLVMGPMVLLYFFSIFLAYMARRNEE